MPQPCAPPDGTPLAPIPQTRRAAAVAGIQHHRGEMAIAFDDFVASPIPPLTIYPFATSGSKIPDGLGMKIADSLDLSYTADFKFVDGKTPCNIPLTAVNMQRLYVMEPGDAPLPEPATTSATITFTGCKTRTAGRFARLVPAAAAQYDWALTKTGNASRIRVKTGETAGVKFRVDVKRPRPAISYTVSGSVFVSPEGGALGGKPLDVASVTVFMSAGGSANAYCLDPMPDGARECKFDGVSHSITGVAPLAGSMTADVRLKDGSVVKVPAEKFDFTALPLNFAAGRSAELTDSFAGPAFVAAAAAGLRVDQDPRYKAPGGGDAVALTLEDARRFDYVVKFGGKAKCGVYKLENVARLAPLKSKQKPLEARWPLEVEVYGC
ncbi:MAG: hypothetical protein J3K34DRAFT_429537 [Monoraphidium minutum]|nr:MAG: hypothetical protein J3K34DRAFT_429537 [Monoraphidium minutum]